MRYRRDKTYAAMVCFCGAVAGASIVPLSACGREEPRRAPAAQLPPAQTGVASYYAHELAGRRTASGERHDPKALTAASRTLPLGSTAKVTNTETGQSVSVEVNDRGPYAKGRILDVSPKAADHLGMKDDGVAKVEIRPLSVPAPAADDARPPRRPGS